MQQPDRFRRETTQTQPRWRHSAPFFIGISVAGTVLAILTLMLDGWIDALAIYIVCLLLLVILLSQYADQQEQMRAEPQFSPAYKRLWMWNSDAPHRSSSKKAVSPAVLTKLTSTD